VCAPQSGTDATPLDDRAKPLYEAVVLVRKISISVSSQDPT
jgi:hypothetical protein